MLFVEGEASSTVVRARRAASCVIEAGGVVVNRHTAPGTFVGEIGALLGQPRTRHRHGRGCRRSSGRSATPTSSSPPTRSSGSRWPASSPAASHRLTAYVADVQRQFGDRRRPPRHVRRAAPPHRRPPAGRHRARLGPLARLLSCRATGAGPASTRGRRLDVVRRPSPPERPPGGPVGVEVELDEGRARRRAGSRR